jgi:transketolase
MTEYALSDDQKTPAYIRLAREKTPVVTTPDTVYDIHKAALFFIPSPEVLAQHGGKTQVGIVATGSLVANVLRAAQWLEREGISVKVLYVGTIKPLDTEEVLGLAHSCLGLVTVEEHQIAGGLGSLIAEVTTSSMATPVPIERIGIQDKFGQSGTPDELIEYYGMGVAHIVEGAKRVIAKK